MTNFLKVAFAVAAVAVSGFSITSAIASPNDMPACQSSAFTTHGVWDCR